MIFNAKPDQGSPCDLKAWLMIGTTWFLYLLHSEVSWNFWIPVRILRISAIQKPILAVIIYAVVLYKSLNEVDIIATYGDIKSGIFWEKL